MVLSLLFIFLLTTQVPSFAAVRVPIVTLQDNSRGQSSAGKTDDPKGQTDQAEPTDPQGRDPQKEQGGAVDPNNAGSQSGQGNENPQSGQGSGDEQAVPGDQDTGSIQEKKNEAAEAVDAVKEEAGELVKGLRDVWYVKIAEVDEKPITIGKVIIGGLLILLGVWAARILSLILGKKLLPRFGLNSNASAAFQTVIFYLMICIFTLIALQIINIPITVFTLLGGAVAIGIGFGSQNIMNNFISGLILLAERPIKIADVIQFGDLRGKVVRIGARSTRIRTSDNIDIIVPNSAFLENNVINWTLQDNQIRTKVGVGFAYGSDTAKAKEILLQACKENKSILQTPAPVVLFTEFGDNALLFEVHFWIIMDSFLTKFSIESEMRFQINELCNQAELVIAFPQRDVHMDTLKPLEIRLLNHDKKVEKTEKERTEKGSEPKEAEDDPAKSEKVEQDVNQSEPEPKKTESDNP